METIIYYFFVAIHRVGTTWGTQNLIDKTASLSGLVSGPNKRGGTSRESDRQVQLKSLEVINQP